MNMKSRVLKTVLNIFNEHEESCTKDSIKHLMNIKTVLNIFNEHEESCTKDSIKHI